MTATTYRPPSLSRSSAALQTILAARGSTKRRVRLLNHAIHRWEKSAGDLPDLLPLSNRSEWVEARLALFLDTTAGIPGRH